MKQVLIAVDQFINTLVPLKNDGFGMADETLSARAWRMRAYSRAYVWINRIFFWEENHCKDSYTSEILRRHLPDEYTAESF